MRKVGAVWKAWVTEEDSKEMGVSQTHILTYVGEYALEYGYPPTIREIRDALGFSTTSLVQYHLNKLIGGGLLTKVPGKARTLRVSRKAKKRVPSEWK